METTHPVTDEDASLRRRLNERVYHAESKAKHPRILLREMFQDLRSAAPMARQLLKRNILSQYRESLLGPLWALIPAMFTAMLMILATQAKVIRIGMSKFLNSK